MSVISEYPNNMNDVAVNMSIMGQKAQGFVNKSVEQHRQMIFVNPTSAIPTNLLGSNGCRILVGLKQET